MADHPTHNDCPRCGAKAGRLCADRHRNEDAHSERRALGLDDPDAAGVDLDVQSATSQGNSRAR